MSLQPATYEIALERAQARRKPRTPLRSRSTLKTSPARRRAPKKKRKKRLTTGQLKKRAWREFSIFIRARGADSEGMVKCCTCGSVKHWKQMQAGHFIPGRLNNNLFSESGTNAQCSFCNVVRNGNGPRYYQFMLAKHGQEVIDDLMLRNDQTHKWLPGELQSLWEKYKALNALNPLLKDDY